MALDTGVLLEVPRLTSASGDDDRVPQEERRPGSAGGTACGAPAVLEGIIANTAAAEFRKPITGWDGVAITQDGAVAARHADVVGFAGLGQMAGNPSGTFTLCSARERAERVDELRRVAGDRPYRSDVLLQKCHRSAAGGRGGRAGDGGSRAHVRADPGHPFALFGPDKDHAAEELRRRQRVDGFDSVTSHQPNMDALGERSWPYRSTDGPDPRHAACR
jgi:hypothetical protein